MPAPNHLLAPASLTGRGPAPAVLPDATNLNAEARSVARYRKLAWTAGRRLREQTCRPAS